ncbi:tyrosine-type recombinase/integrase [Bifidobacterium scaligerum]|uniref:Site-specific integrase n=1 Tax=Bifidobacterium scaligerum TaxID=2052656 RepID=A0A2M9HP02_9BIFI|nr:tyrosine-type recombinase/integrase [Bifidobacterium scaligerum]PJM78554.1 hypothetical protein CUU80_08905 [Bifidobacterium scaligerum]
MDDKRTLKKAPYGEGTIFWSESMRMYVARFPASMYGRKVSGYGKTRETAVANRAKAVERLIKSTQRLVKNPVGKILDDYYAWLDGSNRKQNTVYGKKQRLNKYLKPYMTKPIMRFTENDILDILQRARKEAKAEENSRIANQIYSEINQFLNYAMKRKYIKENPIVLIEKPSYKSKARQDNELYIDERIRLGKELLQFTANHADKYGTMYGILLIASLGLRTSEIRGLTWDCFEHLDDKDNAILNVKQQYQKNRTTGKMELVEWTKTDSGFRKIALPESWRKNLWDYRSWQYNLAIFGVIRSAKNLGNFCFVNKFGNPFSDPILAKYWHDLKNAYEQERQKTDRNYKLSDLDKNMRLYDMRHVCASLLISSGQATIDQLRPILGHMDRRMTEYYTHLTMESERKIMNNIPQLIGGIKNTLK